MKIGITYLLTLLLAAGTLFVSCGPEGGEVSDSFLEVSPQSVTLDPQGGQEFLTIRSSDDWLIRSDAKWLKMSPSSGKASADPVKTTVTFDANADAADRNAVIIVKTLNGKTAEVKVQQAKVDGPVTERGISSAEDLVAFAQAVNAGEPLTPFMKDGVVVLLGDIDVSSVKEWTPAGTAENPFTGTFDGKGYAIKNIGWTIDASVYPAAGIIGYAKGAGISGLTVGASGDRMTIKGNVSSVDAGAVVGYAEGGSVSGCLNNADIVYEGSGSGQGICIAGICGRYMASSGSGVVSCTNRGDVMSAAVCRAAGFVAYNEGVVTECINSGCILAEKSGEIGPAWGCSYNRVPDNFIKNTGKGHVGGYAEFKDDPESADSDAYLNAVASPAKEGYALENVTVDATKESYYDWTEVSSMQVCSGVKYTHYDCDNVPRKVHILEIDLTDPGVEVTTAYADDCVPNPNGNKNSNNGFKIRETLSQLCERKRGEGDNIVAGINTGFFDSNDGISRGFHIEEGEPVYINNPDVVQGLPNHSWGFTVFTDGTASCGKKTFKGKVRSGDKEFSWYSFNDTIVRNVSAQYQINLYDSHYKEYPHPSHTNLVNRLAADALYVVAEYTGSPMTVNNGYAEAKVVAVEDGRSSALSKAPYVTSENQIGMALSGAAADSFKSLVSVGSTVEFRCDITIEDETTRPIYTQNSTMYHLMKDGKDNLSSIGSTSSIHTKQDPLTFPVISQDKTKVWLVEIDGRQDWYSTGVNGYEMYRIAAKLGGYNMTRFDGGGSSAMWVYDSASGKGGLVNSVSDSKGERSCLNYLLIRAK